MSIAPASSDVSARAAQVLKRVREIAALWATQRQERQRRTSLDPADFDLLRDAGVHLIGVPVELGGLWQGSRRSTRQVCEIVRMVAHGDPSVALVCTMHPAVLQPFLATRDGPEPYRKEWEEQRKWAFRTVLDGAWWGTLNSEPGKANDKVAGSGIAREDSQGYRLTGLRHFGTGSGMTSFMVTSAIPDGESEAETFILDVRGIPWDGSAGMKLVAPWEGHGMMATQSHAFEFSDFPMTRLACPARYRPEPGGFFAAACAAVVLAVVETAVEAAHSEIGRRQASLLDYERVEWTSARNDAWLMVQAYEGMLRAIEDRARARPGVDVLRGKVVMAQLAESVLTRICRVVGARTYSRTSPFGFWYEDVRALGFLRPSWRVAYQDLYDLAVSEPLSPLAKD
jgi:alkylation response protein AidB-like acyl-CoA dehydrogenase